MAKGARRMERVAKPGPLLSFRPPGRPLTLDGIEAECRAMAVEYGKPVTADGMRRVGQGSGTHLLKLVTPRAKSEQSVMRMRDADRNQGPAYIPSVNAPDIPLAKIVFRPLEIVGHDVRHLVDHILAPDDASAQVTGGFARVFGEEVLAALRSALLDPLPPITALPAAEFPIIFLPNPAGGDIQATPLSPAACYPGMRKVTAPFFRRREDGGLPVPRGRWHGQFVSAKPQNISGAIGKERTRFFAAFPGTMRRFEAELHLYAAGGAFPRMPAAEVQVLMSEFRAALDRAGNYENADIRRGLNARADALIHEADAFIAEVLAEVGPEDEDGKPRAVPPRDELLLRCFRHGTEDHTRARQALMDEHFRSRLRKSVEAP